jgi:hypothetical protein
LWPNALAAVIAYGPDVVPDLERALHAAPHAPGAPAAAALLGRFGQGSSAAVLCAVLSSSNETAAAEAALALGRLPAATPTPALRRTMLDPARSALVRTAAAHALVVSHTDQEALGFLCDVILAGTPAGRARGEHLGLAVDQPRWALERNLASAALQRAVGEAPLALDADASWPDLAAGVQQARQRLALSPR